MANYDQQGISQAGSRADQAIDEGLRSYMLSIYNYMAAGVAFTGIIAYMTYAFVTTADPSQAVATLPNGKMLTQLGVALYGSPLKWVVMFAPLGMVFFLSARMHKMSASGAQLAFWVFAALMGLSLSSIFLRYTGVSITNVFFVTAAAFGALSLYGYTTKKDLSGWGSFLFMGLIGIVIAAIVNIFLQSSALGFAVSVIGVLVFAGLTAYDTQRLKETYAYAATSGTLQQTAIMGALSLYLNFINMFTMLLSLFGNSE